MAVKPLGPAEAKEAQLASIPDDVFEVVNELLTKHLEGSRAVIKQEAVVLALVARGHNRQQIFENKMLNFEEYYRREGWEVVYDKPGYSENYDAYFEFKKK